MSKWMRPRNVREMSEKIGKKFGRLSPCITGCRTVIRNGRKKKAPRNARLVVGVTSILCLYRLRLSYRRGIRILTDISPS